MRERSIAEGAATGGVAGLSTLGTMIGMCCIGPWAVTLFGVSGAIFLNRLEPFRPLILIAATGMLAWAFWRVYRPGPASADGTCRKRQAPLLKTAVWVSAGLLLIAFLAHDLQGFLLQHISVGETP